MTDAGWYYDVGTPLASIGEQLEAKLRRVYAEFRKPIMISECGADTLPGCHMMAPGLWSEEFQEALLLVYARLPTALPFVFGVHVWNLCDFRTPQMHIRAGGLNHKGAFTRLREPKMAAHALRRIWRAAGTTAADAAEGTAASVAHAAASTASAAEWVGASKKRKK